MPIEQDLLEAAAAVADGTPVDWTALERRATGEDERRLIESLHLLARVGDVHESAGSGQATATITPEPTIDDATTTTGIEPLRWGRYGLVEQIGEGGQGKVYRAWDPQLECEVALKVLRSDLSTGDRVGERILREGRALARVRHPNVVNVYGAESHEGQIGLCMEFIRGRTLEDLLQSQGPSSAHEATTIGLAVCRALTAVHAAGIVHRDVKSRNVMREDKGRIVLMDLGTGRDDEQLKGGRGEIAGTPLYMAPEVLAGAPASPQSDIYSVGVLLYHLVTGRYPVEGRGLDDIRQAHLSGRRTLLAERRPDLPGGFLRVIDRAMAADPAARYPSVAVLVHDLIALVASEADRIAPPRTASHVIAVGAATLVAAVIGVTLLGLMTSLEFNVMLERIDMAAESPADWLIWGLRSLIGPVSSFVQVVIVALFLLAVWRLVCRLSSGARRWSAGATGTIAGLGKRIGWDDPEGFGQLAFILGVLYLAAICAWHWQLIGALLNSVSTLTPAQRVRLDNRTNTSQILWYRSLLDYLVLGMSLSLYRLVRMRRRRTTHDGLAQVVAVAATLALATIMWDAPYRLLFQAERPRIGFDRWRCYNLGSNQEELLIYCPEAEPPKVRRVPLGDQRIHRTDSDDTESVFTP